MSRALVPPKGDLPATYQAARKALAECVDIDECQRWADKAKALASYAKQAEDETLHRYADRIKARAIKRCGQLLKHIEPKHTGRPKNGAGARPNSRSAVADGAGLSEHKRKQALRVASVPDEHFERQVESDRPPTITELAQQGTKTMVAPAPMRGQASVQQFRAATDATMHLREFSSFASKTSPSEASKGLQGAELGVARRQAESISQWIERFLASISENDK